MPDRVVNVLDEDPDLGEFLTPGRLSRATAHARAATRDLERGDWNQDRWSLAVRAGAGLLVLDGLLLRRVGMDGRFGAELLGAGDLLRPWQREDAIASIPRNSGWRVLRPTRLAVLDLDFTKRIAAYPEVQGQLVARALRRARYLAVNMAIVQQPKVETRLNMLLWHLADRWGTVRPEGVLMPLTLTHEVLSELLAARRPTVSAALAALDRRGSASRLDSGWLLRGRPPGELSSIFPIER
jgi:CRP/FNR family transcriptional regulator, cyclic AMP receptor protein